MVISIKRLIALICTVIITICICTVPMAVWAYDNSVTEWVKDFENSAWTDGGGGSRYYDAAKGSNVWKVETNGEFVSFWSSQEGTGLAIASDKITGKYRIAWEICLPIVNDGSAVFDAQTIYIYFALPSYCQAPWDSLANFRVLNGEFVFYRGTTDWAYDRTGFMLTPGKWHQCDAIVDLDNATTTYYADGRQIYSMPIPTSAMNRLRAGEFHWATNPASWVTLIAFGKTPAGEPILMDNITIGPVKENEFKAADQSLNLLNLPSSTGSIDFVFVNSIDERLINADNIALEKFSISDPLFNNPERLTFSDYTLSNRRARGFTLSINGGFSDGSVYRLSFQTELRDVSGGVINAEQLLMKETADKVVAGVRFENLKGDVLKMQNGVVSSETQIIKLLCNDKVTISDLDGTLLLDSENNPIIPKATNFDGGIFTIELSECLLSNKDYTLVWDLESISNGGSYPFKTDDGVFKTEDFHLADSLGNRITSWNQLISGDFYIKMRVSNTEQKKNVYFVCISYSDYGKQESAIFERKAVEKSFSGYIQSAAPLRIDTSKDIKSVSVYVWDGLGTLRLLEAPITIESR